MNSSISLTPILIVAAIACVVFLLVVAAMAVGVMFGRRAISGSCGGIGNRKDANGNSSCSLCDNPDEACRELRDRMQPPARPAEPRAEREPAERF